MADHSKIEWTNSTWNPTVGCSIVSPGCTNCYAMKTAHALERRFASKKYASLTKIVNGNAVWTGEVRLDEDALLQPLKWKKGRRIFVNSMSDLFHENLPDEAIDKVFAVMALCPQHTFQVLTKRPERMREYASNPDTPGRVSKAADALAVAVEIAKMGPEEIRPIVDYPGYYVSDRGRVLSSSGSSRCLFCGGPVDGIATKAYCSKKCRQNACFYRRTGRAVEMERALTEMSPDEGEQGHLRVMLYRDGAQFRELVHRLVLTSFEREAAAGEQGCHRDGNPRNNALPNLRWGDQSGNWDDRRRHGHHQSYTKLTESQVAEIKLRQANGETGEALGREFNVSGTQIRNIAAGKQWALTAAIEWPLRNCWKGVSCERQQEADERIPHLLQTPAAVRFLSCEPLIGPIDLTNVAPPDNGYGGKAHGIDTLSPFNKILRPQLDWIIDGGESGAGARPSNPQWFRDLRDACAAAGVAYFHKQNGEYVSVSEVAGPGRHHTFDDGRTVRRVGKKDAGRLLDGIEHNEFPRSGE